MNEPTRRASHFYKDLYHNDPQFIGTLPSLTARQKICNPALSLPAILDQTMLEYASRPALIQLRAQKPPSTEPAAPTVVAETATVTYAELGNNYRALARAFWNILTHTEAVSKNNTVGEEIAPQYPELLSDHPESAPTIAFLGTTGVEYITADLATQYVGAISVPLQNDARAQQLRAIVEKTTPTLCVVALACSDLMRQALVACSCVATVVFIDIDVCTEQERQERINRFMQDHPHIQLRFYTDLLAESKTADPKRKAQSQPEFDLNPHNAPDPDRDSSRGAQSQMPYFWQHKATTVPDAEDPLVGLVFTSGSTGTPKGAMYAKSMIASYWQSDTSIAEAALPVIQYHYLPLSHMYGRGWVITGLANGGVAYCASTGDMSHFFTDMALARPTMMQLIPRVAETILTLAQEHTVPEGSASHIFADRGQEKSVLERNEYMRTHRLGGRILYCVCAGAPLPPQMAQQMNAIMQVPVHNGYGATETGSITFDGTIQKDSVLDYRLVDVPELSYFTTDTPYPRGELLVKTATMIKGYYHDEEATSAVLTPDGFYRTGDIVAQTSPTTLEYIDRRNNVIKLAQGEFVTISRIEAALATAPGIEHIFIAPATTSAYLVAIIVPSAQILSQAQAADVPETYMHAHVREHIRTAARMHQLLPYEIPRHFRCVPTPFTQDNGLLTGLGKLKRAALSQRFAEDIQALSPSPLSPDHNARSLHSSPPAGEGTTHQRHPNAPHNQKKETDIVAVISSYMSTLAGEELELYPTTHLSTGGLDSLGTLRLRLYLEEHFSCPLQAQEITAEKATIASLAEHIAAQRHNNPESPQNEHPHKQQRLTAATLLHAHDIELTDWISAETLAISATSTPAVTKPHTSPTFLLTGATGWIGKFLLLELLDYAHRHHGRVIALIRAENTTHAQRRLDAVINDIGPAQYTHYQRCIGCLDVQTGDVSRYRCGLSATDWEHNTREVTTIVHAAAIVHHTAGFSDLFSANVTATAEIIRLASTVTKKALHFVSTIGIAQLAPEKICDDTTPVATLIPKVTIGTGYAQGYTISKWASELLLQQAHTQLGLPIQITRPSMVLAHRRCPCSVNQDDVFTRLVTTILLLGRAPHSFYAAPKKHDRDQNPNTRCAQTIRTETDHNSPHYDGLPVDYVSQVITALVVHNCAPQAFRTPRCATYNIINDHHDGINLDTLMRWLHACSAAGFTYDTYPQWYDYTRRQLSLISPELRRSSILPIIDAFSSPQSSVPTQGYTNPQMQAWLQEHHLWLRSVFGDDLAVPQLTDDLMSRYYRWYEQHRLAGQKAKPKTATPDQVGAPLWS